MRSGEFTIEKTQTFAWTEEIRILKNVLKEHDGHIFFEFAIPRMGKRADVVLIINNVVFVIEFKVGQKEFLIPDIDQVWDYALDLKNFHQTSHHIAIAPVLIATGVKKIENIKINLSYRENLFQPIKASVSSFGSIIEQVLETVKNEKINIENWKAGCYSPTPTIIEAALALYNNHNVLEITRNEAEAENLSLTSQAIEKIIEQSRTNREKAIIFVTGVPGAGKTLVGLNIATKHIDKDAKKGSVFLSGNGPLVAILREALTRDKLKREKERNNKLKKGEVLREVKLFIQNVHHFRDEYLSDENAPYDHIAIFDEAQRAWNLEQTASFMKRKKNINDFRISEPQFLISCLDRHKDWAVIVCLVGGGQEINTGEAGISEWIDAINIGFPHWKAYISPRLVDNEYAAGKALSLFKNPNNLTLIDSIHLSVSMRSFRAEKVSSFVKHILDLNTKEATQNLKEIQERYPIRLTRDLKKGKTWVKQMAQGSERYGIIVSSQAQRLKPYAIDVRSPMDPVHWFLGGKEDVRSSYYLEDVATEFHVQGLELDWACVTWDADFRYTDSGWEHYSFVGERWNRIKKLERQQYLKNAYRVLLTRARQGMVIVVPEGDVEDPTRNPEFYNNTYQYLINSGITEI